jgi:hypothetical protein
MRLFSAPLFAQVTRVVAAATILGAQALAQSLPLVSVGGEIGWKIPPDNYRLLVPQAAAGRTASLEVYSPGTNRSDIRSRSYFGDEIYETGQSVSSQFKLQALDGSGELPFVFGTGTEHDWYQLYRGFVKPGAYPLSVESLGKGKNSFALRVNQGVRVEASRFTVNLQGKPGQDQVVAFLDVNPSDVGKTVMLSNYDADGAKEMQLSLVTPDGKRRSLKASGDKAWASDRVVVARSMVGAWKVVARILPTTKQFSNSVAVSFLRGDQPLFARIAGFTPPATATLQVAEPVVSQPPTAPVVESPEPTPPAPPAPPAPEAPPTPEPEPTPPTPEPVPASAPEPVPAVPAAPEPAPVPEPTPPVPTVQTSRIQSNLNLRGVASQIVVADCVPEGSQYVPGSSRLGDVAAPDPTLQGRWMFWTLPKADNYLFSYQVSHTEDITLDQTCISAIVPAKQALAYGNPEALTAYQKLFPQSAAFTSRWVINGLASLELSSQNGQFGVVGSSSMFAKGDLGSDLTLTAAYKVAFVRDGGYTGPIATDLLPPSNPFERFAFTGDASNQTTEAISADCCFLRIAKGNNYAQYGRFSTGFTGLLSGYNAGFNGLKAELGEGAFRLRSFAALVPSANRSKTFPGDGTSLYRIPQSENAQTLLPVKPSSEQLRIEVLRDNLRQVVRTLIRNTDYTIDNATGVIVLNQPLRSSDAQGNKLFLVADFATDGTLSAPGLSADNLRFGVQAMYQQAGLEFGATYVRFDPAQPAYAGVSAGFKSGPAGFSVEAAYSGQGGSGIAGAAAKALYSTSALRVTATYRDQGNAYIDPNSAKPVGNPGKDVKLEATLNPGAPFSLTARYNLNQDYKNGGDLDQGYGLEGAYNLGLIKAKLGLEGTIGDDDIPADKLWSTLGFETLGQPITFGLTQKIGLSGTNGITDAFVDYAITPNFGIRWTNSLTYRNGLSGVDYKGSLGVRGSLQAGSAALSFNAAYDLPSSSTQQGRVRLGVDTDIPVSENLNLQLGGEYALESPGARSTGSFTLGGRYRVAESQASAKAQFSINAAGKLKQVYSAGIVFQAGPGVVLSPSAEYGLDFDGATGGKFSLAAAYRAAGFALLTNNTAKTGFYSPAGNTFEGEVRLSYAPNLTWGLRSGLAYRYAADTLNAELSLGATYFLSERFGVGANAAYLLGPINRLLVGPELSYRVADGLVFSAGYNFSSTNLTPSFQSTSQGFFIRLDWLFDETTFGK